MLKGVNNVMHALDVLIVLLPSPWHHQIQSNMFVFCDQPLQILTNSTSWVMNLNINNNNIFISNISKRCIDTNSLFKIKCDKGVIFSL